MCSQAGVGTYFAPGVIKPIFRWTATTLDQAIAWYLYQHVIDGYTFLVQNYNVGDRVCLFGLSGRDGGSDGRQFTDCDFVGRFLSWRIHCPSACGDVVQGIIRYHIYILHLSLTPTRLAMQVGLLSKDNREQIPFAYKLYKSTGSSNEALARGFKEAFCRPVPIDFVGVWWVFMMSTPWGRAVKAIDQQGHSCERRGHNGQNTSFCGCQHDH